MLSVFWCSIIVNSLNVFIISSSEITSCLTNIFQRATITFQFIYAATAVFICVMIINTKKTFYCVCSVCYTKVGVVEQFRYGSGLAAYISELNPFLSSVALFTLLLCYLFLMVYYVYKSGVDIRCCVECEFLYFCYL
jgi:hypothetical protein